MSANTSTVGDEEDVSDAKWELIKNQEVIMEHEFLKKGGGIFGKDK